MKLASLVLSAILLCVFANATYAAETSKQITQDEIVGTRARAMIDAKAKRKEQRKENLSAYKSWKYGLPFWSKKNVILLELIVIICAGIFLGQILEVSGIIKWFAIIAWPILKLGRLPKECGAAFIAAFQSGAVANSMLVSYRGSGEINNRHLYTSVFIVSCLSLFAHLPTFVVLILPAFGQEATIALFATRFAAIGIEIIAVLLVSNLIIAKVFKCDDAAPTDEQLENAQKRITKSEQRKDAAGFWSKVWKRSRKTALRIVIFLIPAFYFMSYLEHRQSFKKLATYIGKMIEGHPGMFDAISFLPTEAVTIIPAQAVNLYTGALSAAGFIDSGAITIKQAVFTILCGSMITAPLRTLKHALPTYVAVLGPRAGLVMAVSAQVLRVIFLALCMVGLYKFWN